MQATSGTGHCAIAKPEKQTGIDVQKALDILNDRSSCHGCHDHPHSEVCRTHQTDDLRSMGQTIDLASMAESSNEETSATRSSADMESLRGQQEKNKREWLERIQVELKSMSVKELLQTVVDTQQQRVATYQGYNQCLNQMLQSGNTAKYVSSCANTTAAFSVLSETINGVRFVLTSQHGQKGMELEKQLANLQKHEKEKLNLTTALHLERIRERNEKVGNVDKADRRTRNLLNGGVLSLGTKIDACVEDINEAIEEIRYALIAEDEAEDME